MKIEPVAGGIDVLVLADPAGHERKEVGEIEGVATAYRFGFDQADRTEGRLSVVSLFIYNWFKK